MQFSIDQLEAFVAAVEHGSFSAAARYLGKAQSRISTAVANLEIDLGVSLFDRSGKYPALTEEGERILSAARTALYQCRVVSNVAEQIIAKPQMKIRLAVEEVVPVELIAKVLAAFAQEFPYVQAEVLWAAIGEVTEFIQKGRVDLGVAVSTSSFMDAECSWEQLGREVFWPMAGSGHPLAELSVVTGDDLWKYTQLVTASRGGVREPAAGVMSDKIWFCDDSRMLGELVRQGVGWAWLAESQTKRVRDRGEIVPLPVTLLSEGQSSSYYLLWQKDFPLRPAETWFAEQLQRVFAEARE